MPTNTRQTILASRAYQHEDKTYIYVLVRDPSMDNASRYPNRVSTTATMARANIYISANESHQEKYVKVN